MGSLPSCRATLFSLPSDAPFSSLRLARQLHTPVGERLTLSAICFQAALRAPLKYVGLN